MAGAEFHTKHLLDCKNSLVHEELGRNENFAKSMMMTKPDEEREKLIKTLIR